MDEPVAGWTPPPQPTQPDWASPAQLDASVAAPQPAVFASWGRRLAAYLLDALIVWVVAGPPVVGYLIWGGNSAVIGLAGLAYLCVLAYFPFFWTRGSTPGMKLLGVRVVRTEDGRRIGGLRAVGRFLAFILASIPFYLGLLWPLWDRQRRGWHDMLAKTFVIRAPAAEGRRRLLIFALIGLGVVSLAGFYVVALRAAIESASGLRDASGRVTHPQDISVFSLRVGDCFDFDSRAEVRTVHVVPCADPHVYEAFAMPALADGAYPGDISTDAEARCVGLFEDYVGSGYDQSAWYFTYIHPTPDSWAQGDRDVLCALHNQAGTTVTGSARGSGE
jgi:uncharacterized RDD family membrane protein YckC